MQQVTGSSPVAPTSTSSSRGLGLQEGALAFLFVGLGLPAETALAASVLNRLALLGTVLSGGVLLMGERPRAVDRAPAGEQGRIPG